MNDFLTVRLNGNEISMMKLNGTIIYQKGIIPEPEIPKYVVGEFYNNTKITEVKTMVDSSHTNLRNMFGNCTNLVSVNTEDWDTRNVVNMENMFYNCHSLVSLDLSNWYVTNVGGENSMLWMFYNCYSLETLDLSNWSLAGAADLHYAFHNCNSLHTIRLDNCDQFTIQLIIESNGFPTGVIEGVTRKIYVKKANIQTTVGLLKPPNNWEFVYVD